uniref:Cytochrome f n=1 Tax=Chenopodium quinoa TaxID=63459 RepID=A0A803M601_CHEQI
MSSSDRIALQIDPGTWNPMDEGMVSMDPIEFHSEEEAYKDRIDSYHINTCLTEAVQTDPATKKDVHFLKYPIYVGGNSGRGQIYPDGSKSNNTVYNATTAGIVKKIVRKGKGGYEINIADASDGREVVDIISPRPELLVSEGESIKIDQPLTSNPNVGGFGQGDAEIVLQDPLRVQGLLFFFASIILPQIFLVFQKK